MELGWRPSADINALRQAADLRRLIRAFLDQRGVLEVVTLLSLAANTTPAIDSFVADGSPQRWLQTSPEFAMKRLLAAGYGDIYQISPAFRRGERGRLHNPEFTLLEWYRTGFDLSDLINEVDRLVHHLADGRRKLGEMRLFRYRELFIDHLGIDPLATTMEQLLDSAGEHGISPSESMRSSGEEMLLDLLFDAVIIGQLPRSVPGFISGYPASQAALARLESDDPRCAARFELYIDGIELANGFHELADAVEQQRRFNHEVSIRNETGAPAVAIDQRLIAALESGLPDCSGVALGLERLQMVLGSYNGIDQVLPFPFEIA